MQCYGAFGQFKLLLKYKKYFYYLCILGHLFALHPDPWHARVGPDHTSWVLLQAVGGSWYRLPSGSKPWPVIGFQWGKMLHRSIPAQWPGVHTPPLPAHSGDVRPERQRRGGGEGAPIRVGHDLVQVLSRTGRTCCASRRLRAWRRRSSPGCGLVKLITNSLSLSLSVQTTTGVLYMSSRGAPYLQNGRASPGSREKQPLANGRAC